MSYIDWNIAQESKRGSRGQRVKTHGKIFFRDGSMSKSTSYGVNLYKDTAPDEILQAGSVCVGSDGANIYLTTKNKDGVPVFEIKNNRKQGNTHYIYGVDLATKLIKVLGGINPMGNIDCEFNLSKVGDRVWKVVDFKIL